PAGSGKTRVLTERTRALLRDQLVPAASLCLVAFNKRAQLEMLERTTDLGGLRIRTLNALALAVLNGSDGFADTGRRVRTIDELDVRGLINELVRFPRRANTDPAAAWIDALSSARLGLRDPRQVEAEFGGEVDGFAEVYPRYRRELARRGVVDFDEQIAGAVELLLRDPAVRRRAQQQCRVLLVDEFQ
ncbi:MAG: UvrD-helicase domain-containing protein, partial [Acidimicrobiales bacterium]|nr:UvrD-helicase domain-containing protein [Acidimicrobiales bacterium]